jgi:FimV-like protein
LLAFKNRVLMDLQRHGFGSKASREAATGASGASVAVPSQAPRQAAPVVSTPHVTQSGERFIGIGGYGVSVARASVPTIAAVASAIVAALLVLIVAIAMGARKRRAARTAAEPVPASAPESTAATRAVSERESAPAHSEGPQDPVETEYLSTLARTPTSKRALMGLAGHYAERGNARGFDEIAQRIMHLSGGKGPNWLHIAALGRQLDPDNPLYASSADEADDTFVESVAGEEGLPPHSAQAQRGADEPDAEVKLSGDGQHMASAATPVAATDQAESPAHPAVEPAADVHEGEATAHAAPAAQAEAPPPIPESFAPREVPEAGIREPRFPAEAIAALNDLDLGLPPRVEVESTHEQESALHEDTAADVDIDEGMEPGWAAQLEDARSPQSVQEPKDARADMAAQDTESKHELDSAGQLDSEREHRTTHEVEPTYDRESTHEPELAHELEPAHEPEAPREPEPEHQPEPTHAPASAAATPPAVAGLGAARFGPLKLAFDLDLPADDSTGAAASTPPQPAFTAEEIAKIARNKLELAAEYIELGDLGGARTLIHEVIESNDPGTRGEAQALLATLAPLS